MYSETTVEWVKLRIKSNVMEYKEAKKQSEQEEEKRIQKIQIV